MIIKLFNKPMMEWKMVIMLLLLALEVLCDKRVVFNANNGISLSFFGYIQILFVCIPRSRISSAHKQTREQIFVPLGVYVMCVIRLPVTVEMYAMNEFV